MGSWLIVERLENWEADRAANFSFFGLSNRYRKLAGMVAQGDLFFSYVSSGISAFADMRMVRSAGLKPLRHDTKYDSGFSSYIETASVVVLDRARWLPLKEIASELELTKSREDWRPLFQTSIRALSPHDGRLLKVRIEKLK
jgi:hypothetical protein